MEIYNNNTNFRMTIIALSKKVEKCGFVC